jgi:hypothetical protein
MNGTGMADKGTLRVDPIRRYYNRTAKRKGESRDRQRHLESMEQRAGSILDDANWQAIP